MTIHFLGTGTSQGIPVIGSQHPVCKSTNPKDRRLRVSIWITTADCSIIVDCGPDFRYQMLRSGCLHVDAILFTHEHADHTAGLDDIRPFFFNQGSIKICAQKRVLKSLEQRFDYIFNDIDKYPGAPSVDTVEINEKIPFKVKKTTIIPILVHHGTLPILGYRIANFAYLTDVKYIEDTEIDKLKNLNVLVINALREEPHQTHFNLKEALDFINLVAPKKAYLTHISHMLGFHDEVAQKLPKHVFLAYDTLCIDIPDN